MSYLLDKKVWSIQCFNIYSELPGNTAEYNWCPIKIDFQCLQIIQITIENQSNIHKYSSGMEMTWQSNLFEFYTLIGILFLDKKCMCIIRKPDKNLKLWLFIRKEIWSRTSYVMSLSYSIRVIYNKLLSQSKLNIYLVSINMRHHLI